MHGLSGPSSSSTDGHNIGWKREEGEKRCRNKISPRVGPFTDRERERAREELISLAVTPFSSDERSPLWSIATASAAKVGGQAEGGDRLRDR
jgi:hypothetical protein